jgi:hypothetical protein
MLIQRLVQVAFVVASTPILAQMMISAPAASPRPYSVSVSLNNSLGIGTFVGGFQRVPSWTSSLSIAPSYRFEASKYSPNLTLSTNVGINSWWVPSYFTGIQQVNNRFLWNDLPLTLSAPNWVRFGDTGITISPNIALTGPFSKSSRALSRVLGVGTGANLAFSRSDFAVSWSPSFAAWIHSGPTIMVPRSDFSSAASTSIDAYMQDMLFSDQYGVGRQTIGMLSNSLSFGWSPGRHSVNASLGWYLNFLRAIEERPELAGHNASNQNFSEASSGRLSYAYTIPVDFNLVVSAGVNSFQSFFDKRGNVASPFFDFMTPGKNQTQLFLQLTAGI